MRRQIHNSRYETRGIAYGSQKVASNQYMQPHGYNGKGHLPSSYYHQNGIEATHPVASDSTYFQPTGINSGVYISRGRSRSSSSRDSSPGRLAQWRSRRQLRKQQQENVQHQIYHQTNKVPVLMENEAYSQYNSQHNPQYQYNIRGDYNNTVTYQQVPLRESQLDNRIGYNQIGLKESQLSSTVGYNQLPSNNLSYSNNGSTFHERITTKVENAIQRMN